MRGSAPWRWRWPVAAGAAAATTAGLLLLGACGSGTGAPQGWRTLEADEVRVSYPKGEGWSRVEGGDLGRDDDAAAVLERDGDEVARVAVRLRFMKGGDVGMAAAGAMASLQPGARIKGSDEVTIDGRDAEKIEYTYRASPGGTAYQGVDVVALDGKGEPLLVRINAAEGALTGTEWKQVVGSVHLGDGG